MGFDASKRIHQHVYQQPDYIHELPVPGCGLERELVVRCEVSSQTAAENHDQNRGPNSDVQTVKAREHEKRGAVGSAPERQTQLGIGAIMLGELQA